jgi:hypothetical protein
MEYTQPALEIAYRIFREGGSGQKACISFPKIEGERASMPHEEDCIQSRARGVIGLTWHSTQEVHR